MIRIVKLKYITHDVDRHGTPDFTARRYGRYVRLRAEPNTPEFIQEYATALDTLSKPTAADAAKGPAHSTLGWLALKYFASVEFNGLDRISQRTRRRTIELCMYSLHKGAPMRDCPLSAVTPAKIKSLRDEKGDKRGAANGRLKHLSAMFGWAIEAGHMKANPVRDVRRLRYVTEGFHTWTVEEVHRFEEHHAKGTKPRLALALLLYLGIRRGDLVRLGPEHVKDGVITFIPNKTKHARVALSHKPILQELAKIIVATPVGKKTFLETSYGLPFTSNGFGNWFRDRCNEAGLPNCSAHGLRKAGATIAAENGATVHQLMALFDWQNIAQASTYTAQADRKRLAAEASELLAKR